MKIVLVSYSQDVSIIQPEESSTFLIIGDEATGASTRVPVAEETIAAITEFVEAVRSGTLGQPEDHQDELEEEPEEEAPPPPPPPSRKTMTAPPPRPSVRQRLAGPPGEDGVPSL